MISFKDLYFHGIKGNFMYGDLSIFEKILLDRKILARSKQNRIISGSCGYNGYDYISVCKKHPEKPIGDYQSGYDNHVKHHINFLISPKIDAIKPNLIKHQYMDIDKWVKFCNQSIRYTDMYDEYQVSSSIDIDKNIIGIGIPLFEEIRKQRFSYIDLHNEGILIDYYKTIRELLLKYNYNLKIYDTELEEEIIDINKTIDKIKQLTR